MSAALAAVVASAMPRGRPGPVISSTQRMVIDELERVLLHDSAAPQYARVVNQYDSRGFVSGIGDFSTADGGTLAVVATYRAQVGENDLSRTFLSTLERLAAAGSADTAELVGFVDAWRAASDDPAFRQVQAEVLHTRSYVPAFERARELGLASALGVAIMYDSLLQHGGAGDPDGLPALITRTRERTGGFPPDVRERDWLQAFLIERRLLLLDPVDPAHQAMWPLTTGRVDVFSELLTLGKFDLAPPIVANPYGTTHVIGLDRSSGNVPGAGSSATGTGAPVESVAPSPSLSSDAVPPVATSPGQPSGPPASTSPPHTTTTPAQPPPTVPAPDPVTPSPGLLVRLVNPATGKALGVADASTQDGALIVLRGGTGLSEQWRLSFNAAGCFRLTNANSWRALDDPHGDSYNGAPVQQWSSGPVDNPNQAWCFDPASDGNYLVRSLVAGRVLDVTKGQSADGTPIQLWEGWTENPNQLWRLELV